MDVEALKALGKDTASDGVRPASYLPAQRLRDRVRHCLCTVRRIAAGIEADEGHTAVADAQRHR